MRLKNGSHAKSSTLRNTQSTLKRIKMTTNSKSTRMMKSNWFKPKLSGVSFSFPFLQTEISNDSFNSPSFRNETLWSKSLKECKQFYFFGSSWAMFSSWVFTLIQWTSTQDMSFWMTFRFCLFLTTIPLTQVLFSWTAFLSRIRSECHRKWLERTLFSCVCIT